MRVFVAILAIVCLCEARPRKYIDGAKASLSNSANSFIIGGQNANPHEFPHQLSQERGGSHSCGASLLDATRALSAAHCVDGALVGSLDVVAGLHQRSDLSTSESRPLSSYTMHANYDDGSSSYANDIAILHWNTAIGETAEIQYATLPASNNNNYAGTTAVLSGWGRTGSSNTLPDTLQKGSIGCITSNECDNLMSSVNGVVITGNHICFYDTANNVGSCNGDSGGPANCGGVVCGVTSFGISNALGNCLQTYPSVYTRTSAYLSWIAAN